MKVRRTVLHPKLLSYFRFEFKYFSLKSNLHYNTQIFNNFSFLTSLILISLGLGFIRPIFWASGLSLLLLVVFLYLKTARLAQGVSVVRKAPRFSRERNFIEVVYVISNETSFPLSDLAFTEEFDGVQSGHFKVDLRRVLKAHTRIEVRKKILLDAGMGVKRFTPIKISLKDELGIFDFAIAFFEEHELEVYPYIEETPTLKAAISPDTIEYGFYEIAKRGDSNLFIGVRDYRHGDPVKHINWKLTKKTNQVVVNEYEKNTNTFITLLLDLELGNQLGFGELSTWESAKDLALSISSNEIRKNNLIQVVSNNLYIPFGTGKSQLTTIEKHFTMHELANSQGPGHFRHLQNLPARGQIYYLCPMVTTHNILESFEFFKKLKVMGQEVIIFVLDPYQELALTIKGDMRLGIREMDRHARVEFERHRKTFEAMGISLVTLQVKKNGQLQQELLKNAKSLLEVK